MNLVCKVNKTIIFEVRLRRQYLKGYFSLVENFQSKEGLKMKQKEDPYSEQQPMKVVRE